MRYIFIMLTILGIVSVSDASAQRGRRSSCGIVSPTPHRIGSYTAGNLAGSVLGDLYSGYTGIRGRVPGRITVDPARQLDSLWRAKIACNQRNPVVNKLYRELLTEYRGERTHITIDEFVRTADEEVALVGESMDWKKFAKLYRLDDSRLNLVKLLAKQISGRDLIAYGLTELMPSKEGVLNVWVLEFLVRNYGPEFVYSLPARHDRFASFGFYQFTSRALFDKGGRTEGASKASRAMRSGQLPGSTVMLRGTLQHRGAYLFAIHNIASLVKRLNAKQMTRLRDLPNRNHDDLIQFVAAAHNGPAFAYSAAERWIDNGMRYEYFVSIGNRSVRNYAEKTKANLRALDSNRTLSGALYGRP